MPIKTAAYPNCCSSKVLFAFDGSSAAADGSPRQPDPKTLAEQVTAEMTYSQRMGYGIITAMLTTEQVVAADVLKKLGWTMSMESSKIKHSNTKLQLWAFACKDSDAVDVVVINPFAKKQSLPKVKIPQEAVRAVDAEGNRLLSSYLRPPVNRWIPVNPDEPMPAIIAGRRVSIRTRQNVGYAWQQRNVDTRLANHRIAERWSWAPVCRENDRITHVYIHPLV